MWGCGAKKAETFSIGKTQRVFDQCQGAWYSDIIVRGLALLPSLLEDPVEYEALIGV